MRGGKQALRGLRILNTRPLVQNQELSQAIHALGGIAIDLPTLAIEPVKAWFNQLPSLPHVDQAIFISANAIHNFFTILNQHAIIWPSQIKITTIGNASASALRMHDITVHHMPVIADSEHLLMLETLQRIQNQTILVVKGENGRPLIVDTLRTRGATIVPLSVYRRVLPNTSQEFLNSLWHDDAVDIILFTSQQAMSNLFTLFDTAAHAWINSKPCVVISDRLKTAAMQLGMQTVVVSEYDKVLNTFQRMKT